MRVDEPSFEENPPVAAGLDQFGRLAEAADRPGHQRLIHQASIEFRPPHDPRRSARPAVQPITADYERNSRAWHARQLHLGPQKLTQRAHGPAGQTSATYFLAREHLSVN
jgi:hypothetical protein